MECSSPWAQDVTWTYIRRSEDSLGVFWTFYVRSIYVLCPGSCCLYVGSPWALFSYLQANDNIL